MRLLSLFDTTGYAVLPFTECGWETIIVDTLNTGDRAVNPYASKTLDWNISEKEADLIALQPDLILSFPPCTDLAVSGAAHFASKKQRNPAFQDEATYLARTAERIGTACKVDWMAENPISVLSTLWRKPNFIFDPFEFGGWLSAEDVHPDYPRYISPQDCYRKKTCWWTSSAFKLPRKKPVVCKLGYSKQHKLLGGKSAKTKMIRSASPRGVFIALAERYTDNEDTP